MLFRIHASPSRVRDSVIYLPKSIYIRSLATCRLIFNHINPLMTQNADIDNTGFPSGYFIIRSVASDRLLDVTSDDIEDGTEIVCWPEKEKSLVESQFNLSWWSTTCC